MNKLIEPNKNCSKCRRLYNFRKKNQSNNPDWFNAPVPTFGELSSSLLIVGLAPGLQGANKTGRPFTGDYAGDLLYKTINKFNFSKGKYAGTIDDSLKLKDCTITNAVRCVPPQNKPISEEINNCNIPRYQNSITTNYNPKRVRKLLLNKKEINKLFAATQKKGMTLIPTKMYFNKKGLAKIGIGIGKGRKIHDKREVKKTRDWERQKARLLKNN
jgi:uracil-DNA glycosylase family 4